jgi:hypothetical protein
VDAHLLLSNEIQQQIERTFSVLDSPFMSTLFSTVLFAASSAVSALFPVSLLSGVAIRSSFFSAASVL